MKRFLYAVAAVALFAAVGVAEDQPAVIAPAPTTVTTAGPVVEYPPATTVAPAAPARRGLFGRLRNRNTNTTTYSTPLPTGTTTGTTTVVPTPSATPMPTVAPPQAMPTIKPSGAMITPVAPDGIVLVGGTVSTASGPVMAATYSEPAPARRGLFGRLRNR